MSTCNSCRTSGTRVATDVVVDGLPKAASTDGIVTTKHLHFRVEQKQIDYGGKKEIVKDRKYGIIVIWNLREGNPAVC